VCFSLLDRRITLVVLGLRQEMRKPEQRLGQRYWSYVLEVYCLLRTAKHCGGEIVKDYYTAFMSCPRERCHSSV
jgi:hypothetical protein